MPIILFVRDQLFQFFKETLDHNHTKVFAVFNHQKATIGRYVVTLVSGEIHCVRPVKEQLRTRCFDLRPDGDSGGHDLAALPKVQFVSAG